MLSKWDERYLEMAELVGSWSKDPSTKCGSVIADQKNRVVSVGFNGFPRNVKDLPELYNDRSEKYPRVIHAERNALLFSQRDVTGYTLYVVPMPPCSPCAGMIIQAGISRVVTIKPSKELYERWGNDIQISFNMFREAGVEVVLKET